MEQTHGIMESGHELPEQEAIRCTSTPKVLARKSSEGILFWCKLHKCWELRTWAELLADIEEAARVPAHN